jgi:hypothetical protein
MNKVRKILEEQKKLLLVYMFLVKNELPKQTNIHDLHEEYIKYVRKYASMKFVYGKYIFSSIIQEFGVRRKKMTGPSIWKQPENYDPQDLIDIIEYKTEEIDKNY